MARRLGSAPKAERAARESRSREERIAARFRIRGRRRDHVTGRRKASAKDMGKPVIVTHNSTQAEMDEDMADLTGFWMVRKPP